MFSGRVASAPVKSGIGDKTVVKFTLIDNVYAGKDDQDQVKTDTVSIQFTAFRGIADAISQNVRAGDQLLVDYHIRNNNYQPQDGEMIYGYNFVVDSFEFGAPGKATREHLAEVAAKQI
jgi:single-strand DNA-binding protein